VRQQEKQEPLQLLPRSRAPKAKASFGFNVMYQEGWAAPKGELQYVDHNINMKVHSHEMTSLIVSPDKTKATFEGTCTIDGARDRLSMFSLSSTKRPCVNVSFPLHFAGESIAQRVYGMVVFLDGFCIRLQLSARAILSHKPNAPVPPIDRTSTSTHVRK
jgi:hypothetical protein